MELTRKILKEASKRMDEINKCSKNDDERLIAHKVVVRMMDDLMHELYELPFDVIQKGALEYDSHDRGFLMGTASGSAESAVRDNDPGLLKIGLMALILENFRQDKRESIILLTQLQHSAKKLGYDLKSEYYRLRYKASEPVKSCFDAYIEKPKTIADMGYFEDVDSKGRFMYSCEWRKERRFEIK